ncbi:MAG: hypothetical protein PHH83_01405 [Patescibacteria group bacterium]|nr:hypothetical protein [Patescibacteria group bacterium]
MKKYIFTLMMFIMLMTILPISGQILDRVYVDTGGDSLCVSYSFNPTMEYVLVTSDGALMTPSQVRDGLKSAVLYFNKQAIKANLDRDRAWVKFKKPKKGTYDFTWVFIAKDNMKAFGLVDEFSYYSVMGNSRNKDRHFEVMINDKGLPIAIGTIWKEKEKEKKK